MRRTLCGATFSLCLSVTLSLWDGALQPCEHEAVCHVCSKSVANCPICGAARATMPPPSATPGPATTTTAAGADAPGPTTSVGNGSASGRHLSPCGIGVVWSDDMVSVVYSMVY